MDVVECENCGGHVVFDAGREAVACMFCGDVSVHVSELADVEQPVAACPFSISVERAQALFRTWARSSFWAPTALRSAALEVRPLWVPAWQVCAEVHASWTGLVDAPTKSGKRPVSGSNVSTREVWVPASLGLSSSELSALAPFSPDEATVWRAETASAPYEVGGRTADAAAGASRRRFRDVVRREVIRQRRVRDCRVSVLLERIETRSVMVPVFVGCVRFRDRPWRFLVNGQTGRVTGALPIDRRKVAIAVSLAVLVVAALLWWR